MARLFVFRNVMLCVAVVLSCTAGFTIEIRRHNKQKLNQGHQRVNKRNYSAIATSKAILLQPVYDTCSKRVQHIRYSEGHADLTHPASSIEYVRGRMLHAIRRTLASEGGRRVHRNTNRCFILLLSFPLTTTCCTWPTRFVALYR